MKPTLQRLALLWERLPAPVRRLIPALLMLGVVILLELRMQVIVDDRAYRQLVLFAMVNVVMALSLNVVNGMAGQFSIGHAGFVGIGAYTAALTAGAIHQRLGVEDATFQNSFIVMPPSLIAAGLVAGLFGLLVGLPSLRLKGDYLAIVTLGFAEIFRLVIATAQTGGGVKGGITGFLASLGGQNGYAGPDNSGVPQYAGPFWIFGAVVLATIIAWRLKFSGWGRALRALREDEIASAAVGVDPTRYKVTSFVIGAVGAGIAGGLLASMRDGNPTVQPDQFTFTYSFDAITMVILGGSGSVTGAIVGGVFVTFTVKMIELLQGLERVQAFKALHPEFDLNALRMVIYAAVLIGLMILRPEGLFGERELFKRTSKAPEPKDKAPPESEPAGRPPGVLSLKSTSKTFGGLRAVDDVTFDVPPKSIFGLIGPNGAGKTTVFNLITGVYKPDTPPLTWRKKLVRALNVFLYGIIGAAIIEKYLAKRVAGPIRFEGADLMHLKPSQIARLGVARTFQNIRLFGQLTVLENVLVACENRRKASLFSSLIRSPLYYRDEAEMTARALALLKVFELDGMADEISTSLSYGNQRRLEIARAMMLGPKVLLLDEPAAGMNYGEAEGLKKQIRWLRDQFQITVVLVEHNMQVVMGVCEEIHVLDHGETIAHGTPEEIKRHPKVLAAYLGEDIEEEAPAAAPGATEPA